MKKAFTLVELMLVVIIIGILVGMVVPRLVGRSEEARKTAAKADINGSIATALDIYEMDVGSFPEKLDELCTQPTDDKKKNRWKGPYLKKCSEDNPVPKDPWGQEYKYTYDKNKKMYELWSCGPDGQDNSREGDDISNVPKKEDKEANP